MSLSCLVFRRWQAGCARRRGRAHPACGLYFVASHVPFDVSDGEPPAEIHPPAHFCHSTLFPQYATRERQVRRVFVGGLATDYCVLNTVLDALTEGFEVVLLQDAIRAVDVSPGNGEAAQRQMHLSGARPMTLRELEGNIE